MKRATYFIGILAILMQSAAIFPSALAQGKAKDKNKAEPKLTSLPSGKTIPDLLHAVYRKALLYEDFAVARMALMQLAELNPDKTAYEDSLVFLYYSSGMPAQAVVLGRKRLESSPDNTVLMEVVAMAEENTGLLKDALDRYEQLEKKSSNVLRKYRIATLQYRLKRYGECQATINSIMAHAASDTLKVNITYSDGSSQNVKLKAAALNVLGMAAFELGQLEDAEALFQASLQMDKDFVQPKINLNALQQQKAAKTDSAQDQGSGSEKPRTTKDNPKTDTPKKPESPTKK
ncbi:MAG: hypothetical protein N2110_09530 [Flavobacteriales bacterium]|nr:hypothetical protein [Flavobacteriales bacterium]MCX7769243.1 hypothetical protein [Flavobacteriales bacterium]MDW8410952.1 hypothetical protein [Flavobacteriales bacterium]